MNRSRRKKMNLEVIGEMQCSKIIVSPSTKYMTVCNGWLKIAALSLPTNYL